MEFGDWLIDELRKQNLTQADLARLSGLTSAAISNYVQGRIPDKDALKKIAKGLKISPNEVFRIVGLLPPITKTSEIQERAYQLFDTLQDPLKKQQAIEYLEFLHQQEEKAGRSVAPTPNNEVLKPHK